MTSQSRTCMLERSIEQLRSRFLVNKETKYIPWWCATLKNTSIDSIISEHIPFIRYDYQLKHIYESDAIFVTCQLRYCNNFTDHFAPNYVVWFAPTSVLPLKIPDFSCLSRALKTLNRRFQSLKITINTPDLLVLGVPSPPRVSTTPSLR